MITGNSPLFHQFWKYQKNLTRNKGRGKRWWYDLARCGADTRVSPQPLHSTGSSQYLNRDINNFPKIRIL